MGVPIGLSSYALSCWVEYVAIAVPSSPSVHTYFGVGASTGARAESEAGAGAGWMMDRRWMGVGRSSDDDYEEDDDAMVMR